MAGRKKKKRSAKSGYYDFNLVAVVILLICFGLVMLYSTSAYTAQVKYRQRYELFYKADDYQCCKSFGSIVCLKI